MKASSFQFSNPYLKELNFQENPDFDPSCKFEMNHTIDVHVNREENASVAGVDLILTINEDSNPAPFQLKIKMFSLFQWEDLDDETVNVLLKNNAPALLLAYIRPIISSITSSSQFPTYNLPFVDFTK